MSYDVWLWPEAGEWLDHAVECDDGLDTVRLHEGPPPTAEPIGMPPCPSCGRVEWWRDLMRMEAGCACGLVVTEQSLRGPG